MNARTLRHDWPGGRAWLGLVSILMILGLGCGSSPPAAQEPTHEPEPAAASEPANEPVSEPAPGTTPDSPGVGEDAPAAEPEQASAQQPAESEEAAERAEPVAEPSGKLLQLIEESEEAGKKGLFGKAHKACSQALEMEPGQPRAVMLCAVSACNLRNRRLAKQYYAMLETEERQGQIFQICMVKSIDLRK